MAYQLTYRSKASKQLNDQGLKDIYIASRHNNNMEGITGCLVFRNSYFVQILEGEKNLVEQLFYTIEDDIRNMDVEILHQGPSKRKLFNGWGWPPLVNGGEHIRMNLPIDMGELKHLLIPGVPETPTFAVFWKSIQQLSSTDDQLIK